MVDRCCAAYENDRLVYSEWASCISREYELSNNAKKDASLTLNADGTLKMSKQSKTDPIPSTNEIQIPYCLVRRGLALEQANILDFEFHDEWSECLMDVRMQDAPPGYQKVSIKQLELADKKFFTLLGEESRPGIKALGDGRPCDKVFRKVFDAPEVRHLLQPRMAQAAPSGAKGDDVENPIKRLKPTPGGKGKGSGKGDAFQRVPTELLKLGGSQARPREIVFALVLTFVLANFR